MPTPIETAFDLLPGRDDLLMRLSALEAMCLARGIRLSFHADMHEFKSVMGRIDDKYAHVSPLLDCDTADLAHARWILGRDARGEVVSTQAVRFYPDDGTDALERWTSLRMFYDRPEMAPEDESCILAGRAVEANRGIRAWIHSGGTWVRKDHRGPDAHGMHLSEVLPRISRQIGMAMFPAATAVQAGCTPRLAEAGVALRYGYRRLCPILRHARGGQVEEFIFLWMTREEMHEDARAFHLKLSRIGAPKVARKQAA